jgi:hypothetical protein
MARKVDLLKAAMRNNPADVRFADAVRVAAAYFGAARVNGSHFIFKMPWAGMPRMNLQREKNGKTNRYQIVQLLEAIGKANSMRGKDAE